METGREKEDIRERMRETIELKTLVHNHCSLLSRGITVKRA